MQYHFDRRAFVGQGQQRLADAVEPVAPILATMAGGKDQPALAGPSTLGYSIVLVTDNDTLTKDGVSTATIRITGRNADGQEVTGRPLRAVIMVDGVVQDYGVLSTKTPVTGSTLRYTAPAGSAIATTPPVCGPPTTRACSAR